MFLLEIINLIKMVPEAKLSLALSAHIPSKFQHKALQSWQAISHAMRSTHWAWSPQASLFDSAWNGGLRTGARPETLPGLRGVPLVLTGLKERSSFICGFSSKNDGGFFFFFFPLPGSLVKEKINSPQYSLSVLVSNKYTLNE